MSDAIRAARIRHVLLTALVCNVLLAGLKFWIGWRFGSLGVLSDAMHSLLDGAASVIALIGITAAARPPDANHPYGHRKYEILTTMIVAGLLFLSAWEILGASISRLLHHSPAPQFSWLGLSLLTLGIVVNTFLSNWEKRAGLEVSSPLLLADATHTRTDIYSSLLAIAALGSGAFQIPWLDPLLAIGIVIFLGRAIYEIFLEGVKVVSDATRLDPALIRSVAEKVEGVRGAHAIRSHGMQNDIHIDLHIQVADQLTARQVFEIENRVNQALRDSFPGVTHVALRHEPGDLPIEPDA
ncbi:MAG: cation diffusion facilitator family transporter [Candidatus Pacebacteria bacterium]|nr:cation diffusion facilitator family transporter [Candidatus Paceibacterota bacterium]